LEVKGTFERFKFRDVKSGMSYISLKVSEDYNLQNIDNYGCITVSCICGYYAKGAPLIVIGDFEEKSSISNNLLPKFIATSIKEDVTDQKSFVRYLTSLGAKSSDAIVISKICNCNLNDFLHIQISEIAKKTSLSEIEAIEIIERAKITDNTRKLMSELARYKISYNAIEHLAREYGSIAETALYSDPWEIGRKIGLSFIACDSIGKEHGISYVDDRRINAILKKAFELIGNTGHCYVDMETLIKYSVQISVNQVFGTPVPDMVISQKLYSNKTLFIEEGNDKSRIYLKKIRYAEINSANQLYRLCSDKIKYNYNEQILYDIEKEKGIQYASQQKLAFKTFLKESGVYILTGGPGTGKTATVDLLVNGFMRMNPELNIIKMSAPTGRAAQRMTEATERPAETIHKMCDYRPYNNNSDEYQCKDADNPICADVIICDEMSMTDIELFSILVTAIKTGTLLILVGDVNQLSSVGPGNVLEDLINSGCIPTVMLTEVFRQKGDSPIVTNAYKINEGKTDLIYNDNFQLIRADSDVEGAKIVCEQVLKYYDHNNQFDVQLLAPTRKGPMGVNEMNKKLQQLLNTGDGEKITYGNSVFKERDKVILMNNNYGKDYFNGDIGIIDKLSSSEMIIPNGTKITELGRENFDDVSLAYGMTVHKSQGSEYKVVIIALPKEPKIMLKRKILYTAVTRAKLKVIIVSTKDALEIAIRTSDVGQRNTSLAERIILRFNTP